MKESKGFIELNTVNDYWKKLQYDYSQLKDDNENVYVAFNFFVTAYHMVDWIVEGKKHDSERTKLNNIPIIKICFHICNGAKHFNPKDKRNDSIKHIEKEGYVDDDYCDDYFENPIMIYFEDELNEEFGSSLSITELSEKIMLFWEKELIIRKLI